jgi:hypothetical protein
MSRSLQRCGWPVLVAVVLGAAALARADDAPATASPNQGADAAKPEAANPAPAPAAGAPAAPAVAAPAAGGGTAPYRVVDGDHVDANTMKGWRTWRALACERCHGANQEGLVGPSLVDGLKTMSREDFDKCVLQGRIDKGMPNFGEVKTVVDNLDNLYAFLKGRSDGAIPPGHLKEIQ